MTAGGRLRRAVDRATAEWHPGAAYLTRALAIAAPTTGCANTVIRDWGPPSSVLSRLARAGLPSPKAQLALFRITLVLLARESRAQVREIAYGLNFSSPQCLGRTVRQQLGVTALELFAQHDAQTFWKTRVAEVLRWDDPRWRALDPLSQTRITRQAA